MADAAPSLAQLRAEIDEIDDQLLELLARRIAIGRRVAAAKGDQAGPFLRPGREAEILRRLIGKRVEDLPAAAVERVWREILAANLARQIDPVYAVWDPTERGDVVRLARERGGAATRVTTVASAAEAFTAVRLARITLAVLPALSETRWRWWPALLQESTPKPRIVARLPFFEASGPSAICVAVQDPDPSGDDVTYYAVPGSVSGALDIAEAGGSAVWSLMQADGFVEDRQLPEGARPLGIYARAAHSH